MTHVTHVRCFELPKTTLSLLDPIYPRCEFGPGQDRKCLGMKIRGNVGIVLHVGAKMARTLSRIEVRAQALREANPPHTEKQATATIALRL